MARPDIKFCRLCGTPSDRRVPPGEDRERAVCRACGYVDYVNPTNVVGTVPIWGADGGQVLLCLRAIEPRKGLWTLPAGFLEYGETLADGRLPPVLPIVLYNGSARWSAADDVGDLIFPRYRGWSSASSRDCATC